MDLAELLSISRVSKKFIPHSKRQQLCKTQKGLCKLQTSSISIKMATKRALKTTFEPGRVIQPIFTGGSVSIDNEARILATTLGEDVILTDPASGRSLAVVEGVSVRIKSFGET